MYAFFTSSCQPPKDPHSVFYSFGCSLASLARALRVWINVALSTADRNRIYTQMACVHAATGYVCVCLSLSRSRCASGKEYSTLCRTISIQYRLTCIRCDNIKFHLSAFQLRRIRFIVYWRAVEVTCFRELSRCDFVFPSSH